MLHSSPRMALKLLDPSPPSSLHAFCARCGAPPARNPAQSALRESRVCAHCGLGLVLRTPLAVDRDSPFLVVDRALEVSAVARSAESMLGLDERHALGLAVGALLRCALGSEEFAALLRDAVLGGGNPEGVDCWLNDEQHGEPLRVRVGPCGPPPGALLVFDPTAG